MAYQMIVAADKNWGIGNKGSLLVHIPADMKMFRQMTTGGVIVLGRKTLETFPQGKPLPNRINIILSKNKDYIVPGAIVVHDLLELSDELLKYEDEKVFIIGGESIYRQCLPWCDTVHVTRLDAEYESDAFFPAIDKDPKWRLTGDSDEQTYFDLPYYFHRYERIK